MISVIIPAHNGAEFLSSALASIDAQQFANREVLLIDDGSSPPLDPPTPVHCIRQTQKGPAAARNRGIQESGGEFLAFLDIDDLWAPGHLARLHHMLMESPEAGIAQGRMQQFNGDRISGVYRMPYIGSCLFRRTTFEICGLFDETLSLGEDHDLIYRCWEKDILKVHLQEVSLLYRRHAGNVSRGKNLLSHAMILKRRMERIRTGQFDPAEPRRFDFREYIGETEGASEWRQWSAS